MIISRTTSLRLEEETKKPTPDFALVFYDTPSGVAVTRHNFVGETMQTGKILDQEAVLNLIIDVKNQTVKNTEKAKSASGKEAVSLTPMNLIFEDSDTLVWYQPSRIAPMWYRLSGREPFSLLVEWPALLFMVKKDLSPLRIMTLENNDRPTLDSMTYWTPLGNIFGDHHLCQGSASLPKERSISTLTEIENTFYESAFDGFKNSKIFKGASCKMDGVTFWKNKQSTGEAVDVKKELHPFVTVRELLVNRNDNSFFKSI